MATMSASARFLDMVFELLLIQGSAICHYL